MIQSYPWYIADWRESETRIRLSLAERALYREMLDYCYLEGSLPSDPVQLSRICGCSVADVRRHFEVVSSLFCREGERLTHSKVTEVRAKLDAYHKQKAHAGAASGQTRRKQALERKLNVRSTAVEPSPTPAPEPAPTTSQGASIASIPRRPENSPPWDEVNEAWKWFRAEYPGDVNDFTDLQLFIAVMETAQDIADLYRNLPLWKSTKRWQDGFFKESKNFLSERVFKITPKIREPSTSGRPLSKTEAMLAEAERLMDGV